MKCVLTAHNLLSRRQLSFIYRRLIGEPCVNTSAIHHVSPPPPPPAKFWLGQSYWIFPRLDILIVQRSFFSNRSQHSAYSIFSLVFAAFHKGSFFVPGIGYSSYSSLINPPLFSLLFFWKILIIFISPADFEKNLQIMAHSSKLIPCMFCWK